MPSDSFSGLTDEDLSAIIAYLRSVPAVDAAPPARWVGPATRIALVAGLAPDLIAVERIEPAALRASPVAAEVSPAYGEYLVRIGTCRVCHRADLQGGLHPLSLPDEPVPPALTRDGALAGWSEDAFIRAMRSGSTPDGRRLDHTYMPWPWFAGMSNTELRAIWAYLQTAT
jgi:mono/diheme cytochrome c family protein